MMYKKIIQLIILIKIYNIKKIKVAFNVSTQSKFSLMTEKKLEMFFKCNYNSSINFLEFNKKLK